MKPISSSEIAPLTMKVVDGEASEKFVVPGHKIGWVHTIADKPGARFDIVLRDPLGREMLRKANCTSETSEFGELMNIDTRLGEEIEVSLENVQGASEISLFLN